VTHVYIRAKCGGLLDSPSDRVVKFCVLESRKYKGDTVTEKVSITTFHLSVRELLEGYDGWLTVVGRVSGREYQGRIYTEIIADHVITDRHESAPQSSAEPPNDNLDLIPF
jgi:hypothetical protein